MLFGWAFIYPTPESDFYICDVFQHVRAQRVLGGPVKFQVVALKLSGSSLCWSNPGRSVTPPKGDGFRPQLGIVQRCRRSSKARSGSFFASPPQGSCRKSTFPTTVRTCKYCIVMTRYVMHIMRGTFFSADCFGDGLARLPALGDILDIPRGMRK